MKKCSKCREAKPLSEFTKDRSRADGLGYHCKECRKSERATADQQEKARERSRKYREANRDKAREYGRAYREKHGRSLRAKRYGITAERLEKILATGCMICGTFEALVIDHDRKCCPQNHGCCGNCVRGALCGGCNSGIGMLGDSPDRLVAAAAYLMQFENVLRKVE